MAAYHRGKVHCWIGQLKEESLEGIWIVIIITVLAYIPMKKKKQLKKKGGDEIAKILIPKIGENHGYLKPINTVVVPLFLFD